MKLTEFKDYTLPSLNVVEMGAVAKHYIMYTWNYILILTWIVKVVKLKGEKISLDKKGKAYTMIINIFFTKIYFFYKILHPYFSQIIISYK